MTTLSWPAVLEELPVLSFHPNSSTPHILYCGCRSGKGNRGNEMWMISSKNLSTLTGLKDLSGFQNL